LYFKSPPYKFPSVFLLPFLFPTALGEDRLPGHYFIGITSRAFISSVCLLVLTLPPNGVTHKQAWFHARVLGS
jgi:hypothetical protein